MKIILQVKKETNDRGISAIIRPLEIVSFDSKRDTWYLENYGFEENRTCIEVERGDSRVGFTTENYVVRGDEESVAAILNGEADWKDDYYIFTEVERVYATRIDCSTSPGGARLIA